VRIFVGPGLGGDTEHVRSRLPVQPDLEIDQQQPLLLNGVRADEPPPSPP
jgi:hypothetical protein